VLLTNIREVFEDGALHRQLVKIGIQKGGDALWRGSVVLTHSAGLMGRLVWVSDEQEATKSLRVVYGRKMYGNATPAFLLFIASTRVARGKSITPVFAVFAACNGAKLWWGLTKMVCRSSKSLYPGN